MFKADHRVYILASIFLGILVTTCFHAWIEMYYIDLLVNDFETWSFGFSWSVWFTIHHVFTFLLLALGIWGGYNIGKRWWKSVYVKQKKGLFLNIK